MSGIKSRPTTFDTKYVGKYFKGRLGKILVDEIYRKFSWKYSKLYEFLRYLSAITCIEWIFTCRMN